MNITETLKRWYKRNKRDLPWRNTKDPYKIWLSEIILQQTRVNQGLNYYYTFINEYPDIGSLAKSSLDHVLKNWQGLGYYNRARNLHEAAREIYYNMNGRFPDHYKALLKLKGVGEYTAAAIASFAFNEPVAVVDGNVQRFLSRLYGLDTLVNSSKGKKEFNAYADKLLDKKDPGEHNQAMIEFGATYCIPQNPDCEACPFNNKCYAYNNNMVNELPVKKKPQKPTSRYFYYIVLKNDDCTFLVKRKEYNDIWRGLYQFPLIETPEKTGTEDLTKTKEWKNLFQGLSPVIDHISEEYIHILSHQRLHAVFITITLDKINTWIDSYCIKTPIKSIEEYAIPRLIDRFLENENLE